MSKLRSQIPDSAPFPDSARLPPEKSHADAFAKYLLNESLDPGAFDLRYGRYLVDASIEPRIKVIHLFGYIRKGEPEAKLKIDFTIVRT
jgi:hypothetical protein